MKRNAIILAAGTSSRFVPISFEIPKSLLKVRGEILIERQIKQLQEAGIYDITVVVGYKKELFYYLKDKYNVSIVDNEEYHIYNNTSSLMKVLDKLGDTYICSSDNYFTKNVFLENEEQAYYSAIYIDGKTDEYCIQYDKENTITEVIIGGENSYVMLGHVYFDKNFSKSFKEILKNEYKNEETRKKLWEQVYIKYISTLKMKIKKYILVFLVMGSALSFSSSRRLKRLGKRISNIVKKDKDKETTNKQGTGDIFKKIEKKDKNKKDKEDENVNRAGIDEAIKKKKADENSPKTNIKGTSEGNRYKNNQ